MKDKANPSAEAIELSQINPLLAGIDTTGHVRTVIDALALLMLDQSEEPPLSMRDGVYMIHQWLSLTLKFVDNHPKVEKVTPVIEEVGS